MVADNTTCNREQLHKPVLKSQSISNGHTVLSNGLDNAIDTTITQGRIRGGGGGGGGGGVPGTAPHPPPVHDTQRSYDPPLLRICGSRNSNLDYVPD